MSSQLPANPSLQFLKKLAKRQLRTMPHGKLSHAQHTLALEYGFASWAKLKTHVEALSLNPDQVLKAAVCESDANRVYRILKKFPQLVTSIDDPMPDYGYGQNALFAGVQRSDKATIDVLLQSGANIHQKTDWWAGGFGVLDECDQDLVEFLIARGAKLDAYSASRLGRISELKEMVSGDSDVVHDRGGDGQTPLHFASTVEVAEFLLTNGATIDALDTEHESTPAQYMLRVDQKRRFSRDRQDVARYLVTRGCRTDIFMATALGNLDLVRRQLDTDPTQIRTTVSDKWFPKQNPKASGTIYIQTLGLNRTAHSVARDFGHEDIFQLLLERTPEDLQLAIACELGDETVFREFISKHPNLAQTLSEIEKRKLPDAAQGNNLEAVQLMLEAGWPADALGEMGATALHWAAFNGNAEITQIIMRFHPALEQKSIEYSGTALAWAIFGSGNSPRREIGDYLSTIRMLLAGGASMPPDFEDLEPSEAVLEVLP